MKKLKNYYKAIFEISLANIFWLLDEREKSEVNLKNVERVIEKESDKVFKVYELADLGRNYYLIGKKEDFYRVFLKIIETLKSVKNGKEKDNLIYNTLQMILDRFSKNKKIKEELLDIADEVEDDSVSVYLKLMIINKTGIKDQVKEMINDLEKIKPCYFKAKSYLLLIKIFQQEGETKKIRNIFIKAFNEAKLLKNGLDIILELLKEEKILESNKKLKKDILEFLRTNLFLIRKKEHNKEVFCIYLEKYADLGYYENVLRIMEGVDIDLVEKFIIFAKYYIKNEVETGKIIKEIQDKKEESKILQLIMRIRKLNLNKDDLKESKENILNISEKVFELIPEYKIPYYRIKTSVELGYIYLKLKKSSRVFECLEKAIKYLCKAESMKVYIYLYFQILGLIEKNLLYLET